MSDSEMVERVAEVVRSAMLRTGCCCQVDICEIPPCHCATEIAKAAIATIQVWQPIETAPRDGTWVLLYHKHARIGDWYWDGKEWNNDTLVWPEVGDGTDPTCWMPLLKPPTEVTVERTEKE